MGWGKLTLLSKKIMAFINLTNLIIINKLLYDLCSFPIKNPIKMQYKWNGRSSWRCERSSSLSDEYSCLQMSLFSLTCSLIATSVLYHYETHGKSIRNETEGFNVQINFNIVCLIYQRGVQVLKRKKTAKNESIPSMLFWFIITKEKLIQFNEICMLQ